MAIINHKGQELQASDAPDSHDYELLHPSQHVGSHVSTIPLQGNVASPRLFYGARFLNQAMPLVNREAPLVKNTSGAAGESDAFWGEKMGITRSKVAGTVKAVTPNAVIIRGDDGKDHEHELYEDFAFNRKTSISSHPKVQPGARVDKGHLLATTDFTDDNGHLAMGANVRCAFGAYNGHSTDDALVISESLAKRMASIHMSNAAQDFDESVKGGRDHFLSLFPKRFTQEQLKHMTEDGIPKKGAVLHPGDPLILATKAKSLSSASQLGSLSRVMRDARSDASHVWDGDVPVTVTDAVRTKDGVSVFYKYHKPIKEGDKMALRHGQKNIVTKILADHEMPRTADGKPLEMLQNPLGLYSRINCATPLEALLGKVAAKTGKPIALPPFMEPGQDAIAFVQDLLKKHGIEETEHVYDPLLGRNLDKPLTVGNVYAYRLHHVADDKLSNRGQGGYDQDEQPLRGQGDAAGAKRQSALENNGIVAAGAYGFLRDMTVRGQKNQAYWKAYKMGHTPPEPGVPLVFHKLRGLMAGMGVRTRDLPGDRLRLAPMTDKDVDELKPVDITEPHIVEPDTLEGKDGGLFSKELVSTNKWGRIKLPFRIVNPVFEDHVRKAMGLTEKEYAALLRGEHHYKHRA